MKFKTIQNDINFNRFNRFCLTVIGISSDHTPSRAPCSYKNCENWNVKMTRSLFARLPEKWHMKGKILDGFNFQLSTGKFIISRFNFYEEAT